MGDPSETTGAWSIFPPWGPQVQGRVVSPVHSCLTFWYNRWNTRAAIGFCARGSQAPVMGESPAAHGIRVTATGKEHGSPTR